jgi:DNA-binding PadR family transcriptional regulator
MNGSDIYKKYRNMVPETKGLSYGGFFGTLVLFTEMGLIRKINHNSEPAKAIYKITRKGTEAIKDVRTFYTSLSQFGLTATKSAA